METLLILFAYTLWISAVGVALFSIYENMDPFYLVIVGFAPNTIAYKFVTIVRLALAVTCTIEAAKIFFLIVCLGTLYLRVANNFIMSMLMIHNKLKQQEIIEIWKTLRILNEIANVIVNPFMAATMTTGFTITVLANFCTIKLSNLVPMPLFLQFPYMAIAVPALCTCLKLYTSMFYEQSRKLLEELKWTSRSRWGLKNLKYQKTILNSLLPLAICVGINGFRLFICKQSLKLTFHGAVIDYTISALLSIHVDKLL